MEYAAIKSYVSKLLFQIQTEINISNSDECIGIDRALHMMRFIRPLCDELRKHTVNISLGTRRKKSISLKN